MKEHKKEGTVYIVMGGQYGSEGKGEFVRYFAEKTGIRHVVRTGGPNAGHTVTYPWGTHKMRHIPTAWGLGVAGHVPPMLYLGPGSLVDLEVLDAEMAMIAEVMGSEPKVFIDKEAILIEERHKAQERAARKQERIGSTQEGIGAARIDHMRRDGSIQRWGGEMDVGATLEEILKFGADVILESTQGFGLSLTASGHYPFTTSRDITPGILLNDAGLSSRVNHRVIAVCRTFPIRVAGNSGPLWGEVDWQYMASQAPHINEPERTTVTGKERRIGVWDQDLHDRMERVCRPDAIALSFLDYWEPGMAGVQDQEELSQILDYWFTDNHTQSPVWWVGTGPGVWTQVEPEVW